MKDHLALLGERMGGRVRVAENGCWIWTGSHLPNGYGVTTPRFGTTLAHRIAYILACGPVPVGLEMDHLCRQRDCVDPDHLEAVTRRINVRRGFGRAGLNAKKTHCPKGHPYSEANTIIRVIAGRQRRFCATCAKERIRA